MTSKQKKSLRNYIECWRPQVANEHSGNFLYLQKNGKPFTSTQHLSAYLKDFVGDKLPGFHPYLWRHWCAIARLIRSKMETKRWDIWDVKEWMGHEKIDTTEDYVKFAKNYHRNAPYDWVRAVLKYYETNGEFLGQQNDTTTKIKMIKETAAAYILSPVRWSAPVGIWHPRV
jgi:integrase